MAHCHLTSAFRKCAFRRTSIPLQKARRRWLGSSWLSSKNTIRTIERTY